MLLAMACGVCLSFILSSKPLATVIAGYETTVGCILLFLQVSVEELAAATQLALQKQQVGWAER